MDPASIAFYNQERMETTAVNPITAFQVALQMAHRITALLILFFHDGRGPWQRLFVTHLAFLAVILGVALWHQRAPGRVASFVHSWYAVPLVCAAAGKPVVTYWAAVIAGVWLYGHRATASYVDYIGNRYIALRNRVYQDMELYKAGVKRLDAAAKFPHATAPTA